MSGTTSGAEAQIKSKAYRSGEPLRHPKATTPKSNQ